MTQEGVSTEFQCHRKSNSFHLLKSNNVIPFRQSEKPALGLPSVLSKLECDKDRKKGKYNNPDVHGSCMFDV